MHRLTSTCRAGLQAPYPRRLPPLLPASLLEESGDDVANAFPWPARRAIVRRRRAPDARRFPSLIWQGSVAGASPLLFRTTARRSPPRRAFARSAIPRLLWPAPCYDPADCATITRGGAAAAALRHNSSANSSGGTATMSRSGAAAAEFFRKRKC